MLNLTESLEKAFYYNNQRDFYLKCFLYSFAVIIFIEIIRNQVSEISLLQLIPGFYLVLLFLSLILLVISSDFNFRFPTEIDNKKEYGTKMLTKKAFFLILNLSFFFLFVGFFIIGNIIIPLSLDSFNLYGEKTLENIWSLEDILSIEVTLIILLLLLSQFPLIILSYLTTEKDIKFLPSFWKILSLIVFLIAGFATPTIDGYTQLSFSFLTFFLYLIIVSLLEKRISSKFTGITCLQ